MTRRAGAATVTTAPAPNGDTVDADDVEHLLGEALARDDARRREEIPNMREREFERNIVDWAKRWDWLVVHYGGNLSGRAYYDSAGFPDLLLIHPTGIVLFRELKTTDGKLTDRQQRWYERLTTAGANVAVWRPDDWPEIVTTLSFGRGIVQ